jgi:DNA-binding CsgD family transcriptional regulator
MGKPKQNWRERVYGHELSRNLRSRLFVLLRDELGLGRQPKVARLLVEEIATVVDDTLADRSRLQPGQVLVLAPEVGQGPSWQHSRLEDKKMKVVALTLVAMEDIERLAAGEKLVKVRQQRMARLVREAYEQGATLTSCQLALMTGVSPSHVCTHLNAWMAEHDEVLPTRGVVEDCSPAVSHKAQIVARHLKGESTSEIARATSHTARSVERYLRRFEQVREIVRYLDKEPDPPVIARILGCSQRLVRTYLELVPQRAQPEEAEPTPA